MTQSIQVLPTDEYNQELVTNAHPPEWSNPAPAKKYNLVVIGGGTAGLVTAAGAAGLGAKVALIEKNLMGGDCLNFGCVPSKALIKSSRIAFEAKNTKDYGINIDGNVEIDFPEIMKRMRRLRAQISGHDSVKRFNGLGIDIFLGKGRFTSRNCVEVDGKKLNFSKAVIAAGSRAYIPKIEGINKEDMLTNETIFSLTTLPKRLAIIGGGPIGCEMAQAFRRFGSDVYLLHKHDHILSREDADAAKIVQDAFIKEGVHLVLGCDTKRVEKKNGTKVMHFSCKGKDTTIEVDEILVATGRMPNVDLLNLEAAGVEYDSRAGVKVDKHLLTTNKRVFAAGDIALKYKFTHMADASARIVIANSLFWGKRKHSALTIPWCTYTDPEIAHVGIYEHDAQTLGVEVDTIKISLKEVDRAILDGEESGFVKIHLKKGTDKILGATIVATHAGEMISEISTAIAGNIGLKALSGVIHPYPTQAEVIKRAADAYMRTKLTPRIKRIFEWILNRRR
jgi:pyruvate/2-oxoglutarate dehydrogenase complex dihydrolipoamide dehydrogenase (E3) component